MGESAKMCEISLAEKMDMSQSDLGHHSEGVFSKEVFKGAGDEFKEFRKNFDTIALNFILEMFN